MGLVRGLGQCVLAAQEAQKARGSSIKEGKMKAALMAQLLAGVVLGDGHGGSHQSQYGGGGGQTAYSSFASGAQDAFNQLGETIPGTPGEDYPILAEVRLTLLPLPHHPLPKLGSTDFLPLRRAG